MNAGGISYGDFDCGFEVLHDAKRGIAASGGELYVLGE
jgi:hypothetical protein